MKPRKLSKTLLAAVLMLSLLVSVFPGFGIASVADAATWTHSYDVVQNTDSSVAYVDQANLKNDFQVYKYDFTNQNPYAYRDESLTAVAGYPKEMSADDLRNTTGTGYDNGYLNFCQTSNTWALTNVNENAKVSGDFDMEVEMVYNRVARVGFRSIVISPEKGKFNLYSADTATDPVNGLAITLTDNNANPRIGIAGAIDKSTVVYNNCNDRASDSQTALNSGSWGVLTSAGKANSVMGLCNVSNYKVAPGQGGEYVLHIQVKDGVVKVWPTSNPDVYVQVNLTEAFTGGYVSFAGHNAVSGEDSANFDDKDGAALVSLKWETAAEKAAREEAVFQAKNEFVYGTDGVFVRNETADNKSRLDLNPGFVSDFLVYRWEFPTNGTTLNGAPTLRSYFANGMEISTDNTSNKANNGYDAGYYSFVRVQADNESKTDGGYYGDLEWTGTAKTSQFLAAYTHRRTLAKTDDFYVEASFTAGEGDDVNTQAIMIAPKGEFAVTQDNVADKGILISHNPSSNWVSVAGAIKDYEVTNSATNGATSGNNNRWVAAATNKVAAQEYLGAVPTRDIPYINGTTTKATALITLCIEVKDGVLSIWNKADGRIVIKATLTDDWAGGNVSYVGSNFNRGSFAGLKLLVNPTEAADTFEYATDADTLLGFNGKRYPNNNLYITMENSDAILADAAAAYVADNYDFYYTDENGAVVKQDAVVGVGDGFNVNAAQSRPYSDSYLRFRRSGVAITGAMVPTMDTAVGNCASLFGSDFSAKVGFIFDPAADFGDYPQQALLGFRMGAAGDFSSEGAYLKATRGALSIVEGATETQLVDYSGLVDTRKVQVELDVKVEGTALTGTLTVGKQVYSITHTLTYDEAGFFAIGALNTTFVDSSLLELTLDEYASATTAANVGDGALTVNRADTDRAGYYKFIITATPDADAALKAGTLIAEDAEGKMVPKRVGFQTEETQGTQYVVYSKSDVTVAATFYKVTAGDENIAKIGTSVNTAAEGDEGYVGGGLRFVYHADIHQNAQGSPYYMTVDGAEKEVADFGAIVALKSTADALNGGLCYENKDAAYVQYRSVLDSGVYYDLCDSYAQFAIQVTNISLLNVEDEEITACGYILFADGTAVSTDAFTTSYAAEK
ncbi:MAG: hypothetical protein IJN07_04635 [Clostridia bacterium]|nr:hypothetical protein [Clostridia bacterium]